MKAAKPAPGRCFVVYLTITGRAETSVRLLPLPGLLKRQKTTHHMRRAAEFATRKEAEAAIARARKDGRLSMSTRCTVLEEPIPDRPRRKKPEPKPAAGPERKPPVGFRGKAREKPPATVDPSRRKPEAAELAAADRLDEKRKRWKTRSRSPAT